MKRCVKIRDLIIGDGNVSIQTMLARKTTFVEENLAEIEELRNVGCDIVRIAVSNDEDIKAFKKICEKSPLPIVSDIQFDYKLALKSIEAGADKVRINPSNIGDDEKVKLICDSAKMHNIPIRIGVNMGSLDERIERDYGRTYKALAYSAINSAKLLEGFGFYDIVLSVKASDVLTTIKACRLIDDLTDYPQHIGVTEAGTRDSGIVKNSIGIGGLLLDNIGDTVRVSLSAPPIQEVYTARRILLSCGKRIGVEVVSCPTCNRCNYDLFSLAKEVEQMTMNLNVPLKIAVMGCVVNGIGEGKDSDIGIAGGGNGKFVVFKNGKVLKTLESENYKEEFMKLINEQITEKTKN